MTTKIDEKILALTIEMDIYHVDTGALISLNEYAFANNDNFREKKIRVNN